MSWDTILVEKNADEHEAQHEGRVVDYTQALHEALALKLTEDPNVIVFGQGINDPRGMFGVTTGLHDRFGVKRVFDTPVSEEALTGIATGAAMTGLRPVYLHNRPDFLLLTFNQLVSHASKIHFMGNGQSKAPLVIWSAIGRGWGSGPQHSQAIQGLLLGVPGLKIIMPSTPYDAKGLMIAAIEDDNPVLIFEHRWLMRRKQAVPEGMYRVPIGKGIYRSRGNDITVVGTSHTIDMAIDAMAQLNNTGISADIIDLRTLKPLDESIILESVQKTGRLLVVDTGWVMGGVCAEIGCLVAERAFNDLKAPVRRIGLPDVSTPAGYALEQYYYPDVDRIKQTIQEILS